MRSRDIQYYGNNGGNMGRVFTGLLVGSLIGAAVGFLMAPVSGKELRRTIREELDEAQKRARSMVEEPQEKGYELQDKGREVVEGIKEDVDSIRENIKDTAYKRKKSISKILGG